MFWRVLTFVGGCSFLYAGINIAITPNCQSIKFGGTVRAIRYSCLPDGQGEISATLGAIGMILVGIALITVTSGSFIISVIRTVRQNQAHRNLGVKRADREASHEVVQQHAAGPEHAPSAIAPFPSPAASQVVNPQLGWRADPTGRYQWRVWDGKAWGNHVRTGDREFTDPY